MFFVPDGKTKGLASIATKVIILFIQNSLRLIKLQLIKENKRLKVSPRARSRRKRNQSNNNNNPL